MNISGRELKYWLTVNCEIYGGAQTQGACDAMAHELIEKRFSTWVPVKSADQDRPLVIELWGPSGKITDYAAFGPKVTMALLVAEKVQECRDRAKLIEEESRLHVERLLRCAQDIAENGVRSPHFFFTPS